MDGGVNRGGSPKDPRFSCLRWDLVEDNKDVSKYGIPERGPKDLAGVLDRPLTGEINDIKPERKK